MLSKIVMSKIVMFCNKALKGVVVGTVEWTSLAGPKIRSVSSTVQ